MITREGAGWQTVIADLSLILFMVTALALEDAPAETPAPTPASAPRSGEAMALYRPSAGTTLAQWLQAQAPDPRQQLTIVAQYKATGASEAAHQALAMANTAEKEGFTPRIVIEQASDADLYAFIAHDLARGLHKEVGKSETLED